MKKIGKILEEFEKKFYTCWNDTELPNPENIKSFMWNFFLDSLRDYRKSLIKEISEKMPKKIKIKKLSGTRANSYGFNQALEKVNSLLADLSVDKEI